MKLKVALMTALLTSVNLTPVFAQEKSANIKEFNEFEVRLLEATDARDAQNPVFDQAIEAGKWDALVYLGQIGGEACGKLERYLRHSDPMAVAAARRGAALCHDAAPADALMFNSAPLGAKAGIDYLDVAMGFAGSDYLRPQLIDRVNATKPGAPFNVGYPNNPRTLPFFGLLQAIVYDGLSVSEFPSLSFDALLKHTGEMGTDYVAAYLLTRFSDLPDVLAFPEIELAYTKAQNARVRTVMVRLMRQYGDAASARLIELSSSDDRSVALEALRSMAFLTDAASKAHLLQAAIGDDTHLRHMALSSLASRDADDTGLTQTFLATTTDSNPWIAVTALRGLMQRAQGEALPIAQAWFAGDDYYKAFSAMSLLAQSDEGKAILQAYADANPDTVRGREAAIALDPSIEGVEKPRKTPSWNMVRSYQDRELVLKTSRGTVCIAPSPSAPFAAANFMLLADVGKMDGMLWHRVIPNFVAQAGQIDDPEVANWGTIREEWFDSDHRIGTVGVATAGRDTGSAQFFINTNYNLHLNNRYTVFGHVTKGLEAAFELQEGDLIEKAETVPAGSCQ